jgi:type VI secretion system FHA domain protein
LPVFLLKLVQGIEFAAGVQPQAEVRPTPSPFLIGRDPACDWHFPDRTLALSARHCEIVWSGSRALLRDLSTNGTFVNGATRRVEGEHGLQAGDRIALGPYLVEVAARQQAVGSAARQPASPPEPAPAAQPAKAVAAPESLRGGDPAAMLPSDWERAPPAAAIDPSVGDAVRTGLTRIARPSRRKVGAAEVAPSPATALPPAAAEPKEAPATLTAAAVELPAAASRNPAGTGRESEPLSRLAMGLGLPADALRGVDAGDTLERVGRLLRAAVEGLREQQEQQARLHRQIGSHHAPLLGSQRPDPLRVAPDEQSALLALLCAEADPSMLLRQGLAVSAAEATRQLSAMRATLSRLGRELSPAALRRIAGLDVGAGRAAHAVAPAANGDAPAEAARLWAIYCRLWATLGFESGQGTPASVAPVAGSAGDRGDGGSAAAVPAGAARDAWADGFVGLASLVLAAEFDALRPSSD